MILLAGDFIEDINIICESHRIAQEAPIPVYDYIIETRTNGGAGHVCDNIMAWSEPVAALGVGSSPYIPLIHYKFFPCDITVGDKYSSITRVYAQNQLVHRMNKDNIYSIANIEENIEFIKSEFNITTIVLVDYGRGVINRNLISKLYRNFDCPIIIDPKIIDGFCFENLIVKMNYETAKRYSGISADNLSLIALSIRKHFKTKEVIITNGNKGIFYYDMDGISYTYALKEELYNQQDSIGAGDIVLASIAVGIERRVDIKSILINAVKMAAESIAYSGCKIVYPNLINDYEIVCTKSKEPYAQSK